MKKCAETKERMRNSVFISHVGLSKKISHGLYVDFISIAKRF